MKARYYHIRAQPAWLLGKEWVQIYVKRVPNGAQNIQNVSVDVSIFKNLSAWKRECNLNVLQDVNGRVIKKKKKKYFKYTVSRGNVDVKIFDG